MMRFRSLQTRITALYSAAFGLAMVLVALAMQWAIASNAERKVRSELNSSAAVIDRIWSMQRQELESVARPVALDFGFREAVASDDDATIRTALANVASRIDVPRAFVVKYDGRVIGMTPERDADFDTALWGELDSGWQSGALRLNDATFQAVAAEIRAPALIGWLVIGRQLDPAKMEQLSALSAVPVSASVVRRSGDGRWVYDATGREVNDERIDAVLERMSRSARGRTGGLSERMDGKMVLVRPLGTFGGMATTALVLDFSIADALAEYDLLEVLVSLAGLVGLLVVVFASGRLARHITRPISALEQAAKSLEKGEWTTVAVQSDDEIGTLSSSFNAMSAGIAQRERRIRHMAYHDALTGLPNRLHLSEELNRLLADIAEHGGTLAVLCLDLDNFKMINDTLGHAVGDLLLTAVATRLGETANGSFIARTGGDEFCVLLPGNAGTSAAETAQALVERLDQPLTVDGHLVRAGVSIGIAQAPGDGVVADDLIRHADLAMYAAKGAGRGRFRYFTPELNEEANQRRQVELDLRKALAKGEFELYFQPLFDLTTRRFSSFEALIRWNHPEKGVVGPADFIPVAEESGLIKPIGEWVLKAACHEAATWPEGVGVAVNFSTVQFQEAGIRNLVFQALATSGLCPGRLEIEITESLFLDSSAQIMETLHGLKQLGVRIALDDFGTGFSSLSYLRRFPFDKLKIDRSFIMELLETDEANAVVKAITDLAAALNMETTAEGVEEVGQLEALRAHGCTNVQGYLFSKPVRAGEVRAVIARNERRHAA